MSAKGYFGAREGDLLRFTCTTFNGGQDFNFTMNYNDWPLGRKHLSLNLPYVLMAKNGQYSINGETYQTAEVEDRYFTESFTLFRYNGGNSYENSYMRLYSIEFYENDVLTHSFVPVRIGDVGYLYDNVSGALLENAGTGKFILGPDGD